MKLSKPDIILFDIDDTLYKTVNVHNIALSKSLSEFANLCGLGKDEINQLFENSKNSVKLVLGTTAASHSRLLYFQRMLETIGLDDIPKKSIYLEQLYWDTYIENIQKDNRLIKIFELIRENSIKIGIVTDLTAHIQMRKLIKLGVSSYINAIVTSEESGQDKPNFVCFSLINEKLNWHHSRLNYWMVGDNVEKDLKGSKIELDATTFLISNDQDKASQATNLSVDVELNQIYSIKNYIH